MKIIIGCGGAIIKDKKILLIKRIHTKKHFPNYRTFPGGTLEDTDKSLSDASAREVKEETNLDFVPTQKIGFYETIIDDKRIIGFIFTGSWSGDIKLQESEVSDVGWFTYSETKELDLAFGFDKTMDDLYNLGLIR